MTTIDVHNTPQADIDNGRLLRFTLFDNAVFSVAGGLALAVGAGRLDVWLGTPFWLTLALGFGLIGYAAMLVAGVKAQPIPTGRLAILGDIGWVVGAVAIVVATDWLTPNGERVLLLVSIPVALFAVGQWLGLRRISNG